MKSYITITSATTAELILKSNNVKFHTEISILDLINLYKESRDVLEREALFKNVDFDEFIKE
jgi:hypothetical protein